MQASKELQLLIGKRHQVGESGNLGWIELVDLMPHPFSGVSGDLAIVNAARVSFLGESKGEEADVKLLKYLMRNRHTSPFEMVKFKFRVRAPLVTWWQWARHRMANYNAQSGRYTPFEENDFYVPDVWRKQSKSNKQASEGEFTAEESAVLTDKLIQHYNRAFKLYQDALDEGVSKELARLYLPGFSVMYTWIVSMDAHNLLHFLRLRMDGHAQYEIRAFADVIWHDIFKVALPVTAEAAQEYLLADILNQE